MFLFLLSTYSKRYVRCAGTKLYSYSYVVIVLKKHPSHSLNSVSYKAITNVDISMPLTHLQAKRHLSSIFSYLEKRIPIMTCSWPVLCLVCVCFFYPFWPCSCGTFHVFCMTWFCALRRLYVCFVTYLYSCIWMSSDHVFRRQYITCMYVCI